MPAITANPPTNFRDAFLAPEQVPTRSRLPQGEIRAPDAVEKTQARQQPRQEKVRRREARPEGERPPTAELAQTKPARRGDDETRGGETGGGVTAVAGNPRATIALAMAVKASATDSAAPSSAALGVAAAATEAESNARAELSRQQSEDVAAAYGSKDDPRGQKFSVRV